MIPAFLLPKKEYVLVLLDKNSLLLAHAIIHKKKFHIHNAITHSITPLDASAQRIGNPTKLHSMFKEFVAHLNIKEPSLIICAPFLHTQNPFLLFQLLLCFSKDGFIVEHVSDHTFIPVVLSEHHKNDTCPELKTLINQNSLSNFFLPRGYHATEKILTAFCAISIFLCVGMLSIHTSARQRLLRYKTSIDSRVGTIKKLQAKVEEIHEVEKKSTDLNNKITNLSTITAVTNNPSNLLLILAQNMPPKSKLTTVRIGNKEKVKHPITKKDSTNNTKKAIPVLLSGITYNPEEIGTFMRTLSDLFTDAHISLAYIKKDPHQGKHKNTRYTFSINGLLTNKSKTKTTKTA